MSGPLPPYPTQRTQQSIRGEVAPYVSDAQKKKVRRDVQAARELYDHEIRQKIVEMRTREGLDVNVISIRLGISEKQVLKYIDRALDRHIVKEQFKKARRPLQATKIELKRKKKKKRALTGTVVAPAKWTDPKFQREAFKLRQRALPLVDIAELLGCTERDVERGVTLHVQRLNESEANDVEIARRVQVEQLDAAIRAILPFSTGVSETGDPHALSFEAMDKLVRLLEAKAKLLGLNTPQRIDIRMRLEAIAETGQYDLQELIEIYQEVVKELPALSSGRTS